MPRKNTQKRSEKILQHEVVQDTASEPGRNRSANRVMDILDMFFNIDTSLTLTVIAGRLNIPVSSAHVILRTMAQRGYLACDRQTKEYSIALRIPALADAMPTFRVIRTRVRPFLQKLSRSLNETVMLGAFENDVVFCVNTVESSDPVRFTVKLGERQPIYASSLGKLYLASQGDDEIRKLLSKTGMKPLTAHTLSIDALLSECKKIRSDGYAINRSEMIEGMNSIGVPIYAHEERPIAGISVVGLSDRIESKSKIIIEKLLETSQRIEKVLHGIL